MMWKKNKENTDNRFFLICLLAFFICVVIDILTKSLAEYYITEHDLIPFIPKFMNLTLTYNTGAAFGSFGDNPLLMNIITWLTIPLMAAMLTIVFILPKQFNPHRFCVCVIAGGAFGNFLDRVLLDGVRDFMDITSIHLGICNFADYFIVLGGVALVFCILFVGNDSLIPLIGCKKKAPTDDTSEKE